MSIVMPEVFNTKQLKVFYLKAILKKSYKEIAELNGTAINTVRNQYRNALKEVLRMKAIVSYFELTV